MMESMRRNVVLLALSAAAVWAQEATPPAVAALNETLAKAGQLAAGGNKMGALQVLEGALIKTQTDPMLKGRDIDVLRAMGRVYVEAQRPADAIRTYQTLMNEMKPDCAPGKRLWENCADVLYDLGTAQMYANDFAGAVVTLRKAIPMYEAMIKAGVSMDYKMAKLKLEGNSQSMLGAALFRSGDLEGGIAGYEKAVQEYTTVMKNPKSGDGLQMLARQSLSDAQNALKLLKDEQAKRAAAAPKKDAPKK
jgi:tetratricopeptide (TPR) repeat protein